MDKPLLLLSAPNNGSDWFADTLINSQQNLNYFREFFNPCTNPKYAPILSEGFGCEYDSCYEKIITCQDDLLQVIFDDTWKKENYNFTKENYSCAKIPFLIKH